MRAVISLGSNSTRFLVVRATPDGRLEPVEHGAIGTRLSEGMRDGSGLSQGGRLRTLDAIATFADRVRAHGASVTCIATSVMRRADDGGAFARDVERIAGAPLQVIDGREEAANSFVGATYADPGSGARVAVVDLGGGSVECAIGVGGVLEASASVEIGAVRLSEEYPALMGDALPGGGDVSAVAARRYVADRLAPFSRLAPVDETRIVGGTASTMAAIDAGPDAPFDGRILSRVTIDALIERLLGLDLAARRAIPAMVAQRADILPAGALIISEALRSLNVEAARVEVNDLLLGYLVRTGPPGARA